MEFSTTDPWWMTDTYELDDTVLGLYQWGPQGVATVKVNSNGSTQPGWGLQGKDGAPGFMENYLARRFSKRITDYAYKRGQPFAYVMRSVPLLCVDIDGKNNGFQGAALLGDLPPTRAERSKSGNGYHLFYQTDEEWDDELGYALFDDIIGIVEGVDIRGVGCVYHHATQRWNDRPFAPLPGFLADRLREKKEKRHATRAATEALKELDMDDLLVAQHELELDLAKPIKAGGRNNTLFAIGSKMKAAGIPGWKDKVYARAVQLGLPAEEAQKLTENIAAYGD